MSRLVNYQPQSSSSSSIASTIRSVIAGETIKKGHVLTTAKSKAYINKSLNFTPMSLASTNISSNIATIMINSTTGIKVGNNGTATAYAQLFTYNNGTITLVGSEVQISTKCYMPKLFKIDNNRIMVIGRESSTSNAIYAQVLSVSGSTITIGTSLYVSIYGMNISMVSLTATTFIIAATYNNGASTYGVAINVNTTTISLINTFGIGANGVQYPALYRLTDTTCLMCIEPDSNGTLMFTVITVSGGTVSYSTLVQSNGSYFHSSIFILPTSDTSKFIIVGSTGSSLVYAVIQVIGTTITIYNQGTYCTIASTYVNNFYVDGASSITDLFIGTYIDTDKLMITTASNTIIVKVVADCRISAVVSCINTYNYDCISVLDDTKVLLSNGSNNRYMTVYSVFDTVINTPSHIFGIAMNDATAGQNVNVLTDGSDGTIFTTLKAGSMYYNADGNLTDYNLEPSMFTLQGGGADTYRYNPDLYKRMSKPYAIALSSTELKILNPCSRVGNL